MARRDQYRRFPSLIHAKRWATNGSIPDAQLVRDLAYAQNHIMAYRRKVVFRSPMNCDSPYAGATGTTARWRFRCHTGYGASRLRFLFGFGIDVNTLAADPRIDIDVTVAGGATTTRTVRVGAVLDSSKGLTTTPSLISWHKVAVDVSANTTYEVLIESIDYCRPQAVVVMEEANTSLSTNYFIDLEPGVAQPVYDANRERTLLGLSAIWKRNGSHLLNWTDVDDTGPGTFATTTWTNAVDGATAVAASSAGYYLGDTNFLLEQWCRLSAGKSLDVVLCAYGSMSAGATGEVRLENGSGTVCSLTGISTTPQWYTTTTTIDTDGLGKVDLQARTSDAANTLTLNAVSLYTYL